MSSSAVLLEGPGAYAVHFTPWAEKALARMPVVARDAVRKLAHEIATVSGALQPLAVEVPGTLRFEVPGYVVQYLVDDASRTLTVLSVFSGTDE